MFVSGDVWHLSKYVVWLRIESTALVHIIGINVEWKNYIVSAIINVDCAYNTFECCQQYRMGYNISIKWGLKSNWCMRARMRWWKNRLFKIWINILFVRWQFKFVTLHKYVYIRINWCSSRRDLCCCWRWKR